MGLLWSSFMSLLGWNQGAEHTDVEMLIENTKPESEIFIRENYQEHKMESVNGIEKNKKSKNKITAKKNQLSMKSTSPTNRDEGNNSKMKEILDNPLRALDTNEKLMNAVAAKGKQMGWNLFPTDNVTSNKIVTSNSGAKNTTTDLGEIKLNAKIKIHQSGDTTDTINILMFGRSGCGQTALLSYLTDNNQLIGTDSMSTQQFSAETFQLPSDSGMTKIRINESPGMCSGFEIKELQQHWNHLISRVNKEGGVSVFLLLIKSNERITSQFIDEIEEFSELYFNKRDELWKRTVVVFTSIDELKGCNSLEDRVNKLETQIAKPGMEKVKEVLDQTSTRCIYVSSIDLLDKQRIVHDLNNRLRSMVLREPQKSRPPNLSNKPFRDLSGIQPDDDKPVVNDRQSIETNSGTNHQLISYSKESNHHKVMGTNYPNNSVTKSKHFHALTNKNNFGIQHPQGHQPCDPLSKTKHPAPRFIHHAETSNFTNESSQKNFTNSNSTESIANRSKYPPYIRKRSNTTPVSDKPSSFLFNPDTNIHSPVRKRNKMSNDTGSNTPRHSRLDSSSSYNNFQSSEELQMKELKPRVPLTYGAKDFPVDTKNTPITNYTNRIQCEQFNAGGLKWQQNKNHKVPQQFTKEDSSQLTLGMYQEEEVKGRIISEKLSSGKQAQHREERTQMTFL